MPASANAHCRPFNTKLKWNRGKLKRNFCAKRTPKAVEKSLPGFILSLCLGSVLFLLLCFLLFILLPRGLGAAVVVPTPWIRHNNILLEPAFTFGRRCLFCFESFERGCPVRFCCSVPFSVCCLFAGALLFSFCFELTGKRLRSFRSLNHTQTFGTIRTDWMVLVIVSSFFFLRSPFCVLLHLNGSRKL